MANQHWAEIQNSVGRAVEYRKLPSDKQELVDRAQAAIDHFTESNPFWGARAYMVLSRGKAYCRYQSDQGTSTFDVIR